jgi:type IV pilus assembly protein PilV
MFRLPAIRCRQRGFSLIEVLVTLVILMVGLLGLAGAMVHSHRAETESYQRVQAMILLQDMVTRINTNRKVASCYVFTTNAVTGAPFLGTDSTTTAPACAVGTAAQQERVANDLAQWNTLLQGAAEVSDGTNVGAMIGARGCISYDAVAKIYLVSVAWQGIGKTSAPPASWNCGKGNYGDDDKLRRVVSVTMRIAELG